LLDKNDPEQVLLHDVSVGSILGLNEDDCETTRARVGQTLVDASACH